MRQLELLIGYAPECENCAKEFVRTMPNRRFCSERCQKTASARRHYAQPEKRALKRADDKKYRESAKGKVNRNAYLREWRQTPRGKANRRAEQTRVNLHKKRATMLKRAFSRLVEDEVVMGLLEYATQWCKEVKRMNREKGWRRYYKMSRRHNKRAKLKGDPNRLATADVRELIHGRGVCPVCGKVIDEIDASLDHIKPMSQNGLNVVSNLQITHLWCNLFKASMTLEQVTAKYDRIYLG